eukprot:TRINITY_DN88248_c0_g1_i1.p1 TRINITY_DN88248_c0_g1~~TRINITY_DN88248_c0_g1_i1.p1  ORF type:complete len:774 (+),score=56.93 TRINITY_DN88248_c0_g1_i1:70-2391(+)
MISQLSRILPLKTLIIKAINYYYTYPRITAESDLCAYYKESNRKVPLFFFCFSLSLIFLHIARLIILFIDYAPGQNLLQMLKGWTIQDLLVLSLSLFCLKQREKALKEGSLSYQRTLHIKIQVCGLIPTIGATLIPLTVSEATSSKETISYVWFIVCVIQLLACTWMAEGILYRSFLMTLFNTMFCLISMQLGHFTTNIYSRLIVPSLVSIIFFIAFDRYNKENFMLRRMLRQQKMTYEKFLEKIQDPLVILNPNKVVFHNEAARNKMAITTESFNRKAGYFIKENGVTLWDYIQRKFTEPYKEATSVTQEKFHYYNEDSDLMVSNKVMEVTLISSFLGEDQTVSLSLHDVTEEQKRAESKYRNIMLLSLSHELRTPLNIFQAFLHLSRDYMTTSKLKEMRKNAKGAWRYLKNKISDILDYVQVLTGEFVLHKGVVKVRKFVEYLRRTTAYLMSKENVRLNFEVEEDVEDEVEGDKERLEQVLFNFLSNAIKYTTIGTVSLKVSHPQNDQKLIMFSVSDTGCGMNPDKVANLFEIETDSINADSSCKELKSAKLSGLGLTISRMICSKMGTKIKVISVPGKGSTFSFTIFTGATFLSCPSFNIADENAIINSCNRSPPICASGSHKGNFPIHNKAKVLVVDDNDLNRYVAKSMVNKLGFPTEEARDGRTALEKVRNHQPDAPLVVLMDIDMPIMNGIEATREIRKIKKYPQPMIVALTAFTAELEREECMKAGMNAFIGKPLTKDTLVSNFEALGLLQQMNWKQTQYLSNMQY